MTSPHYDGFLNTCISLGLDKEASDHLYKEAFIGAAIRAGITGAKALGQTMGKGMGSMMKDPMTNYHNWRVAAHQKALGNLAGKQGIWADMRRTYHQNSLMSHKERLAGMQPTTNMATAGRGGMQVSNETKDLFAKARQGGHTAPSVAQTPVSSPGVASGNNPQAKNGIMGWMGDKARGFIGKHPLTAVGGATMTGGMMMGPSSQPQYQQQPQYDFPWYNG